MLNKETILIIGGGPAGMMAAITAKNKSNKVILLEKNEKVGRKLLITGKGRCNLTNNCSADEFINSVVSNGKFLYSAINAFTPQDTIRFFEKEKVKLKIERGNRVFPESDKAMEIVDVMFDLLRKSGCKIINCKAEKLIIKENKINSVLLENGESIYPNKVIVACGGMSYPLTGSNGDGYLLAKKAGHTIVTPKPSLVPLNSEAWWCKELRGLSLKNIEIKVKNKENNKIIYKDFGEMLFTHFGISGPVILSASCHMKNMQNNKYDVIIDLKPALTEQKLDLRIRKDLEKYKNKELKNALFDLLPKRLIPVVISFLNIDAGIKCNEVTKQIRKNLVSILKSFAVPVLGFRPIEEAIVTSGGVKTSEINPKTMESKIIKNLYFAGEIIDVDAYTGGFNLQIAFCTGFLAGKSVKRGS